MKISKDKETLREINKLPIALRDKVYCVYCTLLFEKQISISISEIRKTKEDTFSFKIDYPEYMGFEILKAFSKISIFDNKTNTFQLIDK